MTAWNKKDETEKKRSALKIAWSILGLYFIGAILLPFLPPPVWHWYQRYKILRATDYARQHQSEMDCHSCDNSILDGRDLSNLKFHPAHFGRACLVNANLSHDGLESASLVFAKLMKARFDGSNMHKANLRDSYAMGASLRGCDLSQANFQGAKLTGADFTGANLSEADFADASYDSSTKWPKNFNPNQHELRLVTDPEPWPKYSSWDEQK